MATPPPSPPQPFSDAALHSAAQDGGAGDSAAPAASSMTAISLQGSGIQLEGNEMTPELADGFLDAWNADNVEKLKKYEAAYARRLKAKYFSKKTFAGVDIFDHETRVGDVIIKSSRWPCTRSFANPVQNMEDENIFQSSTEVETPLAPNKNDQLRNSC